MTPESTSAVDRDPKARSLNAVRSIVRALRLSTRAIEVKMGISLAQLFVLQQLAERGAGSLNELAERTATHQSSVSVVVRRLVDRGFVKRSASPADKRRIEIEVTQAGRELLHGAPVTIQARLIAEWKVSIPPSRSSWPGFSSGGFGPRASTSRPRR